MTNYQKKIFFFLNKTVKNLRIWNNIIRSNQSRRNGIICKVSVCALLAVNSNDSLPTIILIAWQRACRTWDEFVPFRHDYLPRDNLFFILVFFGSKHSILYFDFHLWTKIINEENKWANKLLIIKKNIFSLGSKYDIVCYE